MQFLEEIVTNYLINSFSQRLLQDLYDQSDGGTSDCSGSSSNSGKQVAVGICAMAKKTQSKPMKEILSRLQEFEFIKMIIFPEEVILKVEGEFLATNWFCFFFCIYLILFFVFCLFFLYKDNFH